MRWTICIGVLAALVVAGISPCRAETPRRARVSVLVVDTNVAFGFLPPAPPGTRTNAVAEESPFRGVKLRKLRNDGDTPRDEVLRTVGGRPGEKEADAEQRPNFARDAAAAAQRDQITATTPVLPPEPLPEEKKEEKDLWINVRSREEPPQGSQVPFDTWVLQPGEARPAPTTQLETLRERPPPVAQPAVPFDYTPSPFELGPVNKPAVSEPSSARGILSANPMELSIFGARRETASPQPQKLPSTPPPPVAATRMPTVLPSSPFAPVEFNRESPFGTRPAQEGPALGGPVIPQPLLPGSPAAVSRSPFAKPFPAETPRASVKTREEQATERWEKYFEERKRGF